MDTALNEIEIHDWDDEQVRFLQLKKSCSLGQASASFAKSPRPRLL